jgi:hypothetical protein
MLLEEGTGCCWVGRGQVRDRDRDRDPFGSWLAQS